MDYERKSRRLKGRTTLKASGIAIRGGLARIAAESSLRADPSLSVPAIVAKLKESFARPEHDWRMMSVSVYTHRERHYEIRFVEDRPKIVERVVTNTTEIYSIESTVLSSSVSVQVELVDGKVKGMTMHYLGATFEVHDEDLLALLRQKGRQTSLDLAEHVLDVLSSDPPTEDEDDEESDG